MTRTASNACRLVFVLLVGLAAMLTPAFTRPALAGDSQDGPMKSSAKARLDRGLARYAAGEYEEAIAEFKAGYAIQARREFLFAWAQAERLGGDCPSAVKLYKRFLATDPSDRQAVAAKLNLERCQRALSSSVSQPDDEDPSEGSDDEGTQTKPEGNGQQAAGEQQAVKPPVEVVSPPPQVHGKGKRRHATLGWALMGTGLVGLAASGGFFFAASSDASSADDIAAKAASGDTTAVYSDYADFVDSMKLRRTIGYASAAVGGAFLIGGVITYFAGGTTPAAEPAVSGWLQHDGGGLVFSGSF